MLPFCYLVSTAQYADIINLRLVFFPLFSGHMQIDLFCDLGIAMAKSPADCVDARTLRREDAGHRVPARMRSQLPAKHTKRILSKVFIKSRIICNRPIILLSLNAILKSIHAS